jgi:pyrophosphatase PpaX
MAPYRRTKQWGTVFGLVRELEPYPGITELLSGLNGAGIPVGIVTTASRPLCEAIVRHCGWRVDGIVGYRDAPRRKPHPDPYLEGLARLGINAADAVSVGDSADDVVASRAAGIRTIVGVTWGTLDRDGLIASHPDAICQTVGELAAFLRGHFRH